MVFKKRNITYVFGLVFILLTGCSYFVSWDQSVEGGIGRSIIDIQKTWQLPDKIRVLPNGNKEYKYHLKKLDPSCIHYWIVNPQGIIVDYHYKGRCEAVN